MDNGSFEGILPIIKQAGKSSFSLVHELRKLTGIKKIGHAGTLDPFATGVMVMLIGRDYTKLSDNFLKSDKAYDATIFLGSTTDSYDCTGEITSQSDKIPSLEEVEAALSTFQGETFQTPPMYSAKKVGGKKLYELARKGISLELKSVPVRMHLILQEYAYPYLKVRVACSKGTYIRSLAFDMGNMLGCGAHLSALCRIQSGQFHLRDCFSEDLKGIAKEEILPFLKNANTLSSNTNV